MQVMADTLVIYLARLCTMLEKEEKLSVRSISVQQYKNIRISNFVNYCK